MVPHEEPKPHANGPGLTRTRPKSGALPAGNASQCEIANCRAKLCRAVTRSQRGHAARRTSGPSLKLGLYSVLVVMDDELLSTAILILFFDDRGSVGLARLSFFDDGVRSRSRCSRGSPIVTPPPSGPALTPTPTSSAKAVSRWCRRELRQSHSFRLLRRGMSGCDNSFQERRRVSRDLTASGARTRPTV